ncbi:hypothetical protein BASA60_005145 [Batrachochytrium salamandrivorans]|nr:hypothetical protein BASA60_005145 [Batrachochytrium salamandrivorans]
MDTFIVKVDPSALAVELGLNRNTQPTNTGTSTQSSIAHGAKPTPNVPDDNSRQSRFRSETAKLGEAVNILQAGGVVAFPTETVPSTPSTAGHVGRLRPTVSTGNIKDLSNSSRLPPSMLSINATPHSALEYLISQRPMKTPDNKRLGKSISTTNMSRFARDTTSLTLETMMDGTTLAFTPIRPVVTEAAFPQTSKKAATIQLSNLRAPLERRSQPVPQQVRALLGKSSREQETLIIEDLLYVLMGISGEYIIRTESASSDLETPTFTVDGQLEPSITDMATKILPLAGNYILLDAFVEKYAAFKYGCVFHALCAAIRSLLQDYLVLIGQIEHLAHTLPKFTLQRMWYYLAPSIDTMGSLASLVAAIYDANQTTQESIPEYEARSTIHLGRSATNHSSGLILGILADRMVTLSGNPELKKLHGYLLSKAAAPYLSILNTWILCGELDDPFNEFMVSEHTQLSKEKLRDDFNDVYWEQRYSLRDGHIPTFLDPWKEKILLAGKYLNVLRECGIEIQRDEDRYQMDVEDHSMYLTDVTRTIDDGKFISNVERAYLFANKALIDLLMKNHQLIGRLKSLKRFFLFGQSDYLTHFMDLAAVELMKPATQVPLEKVRSLLELVIGSPSSCCSSDAFKDDVTVELSSTSLFQQLALINSVVGHDMKKHFHSTQNRPMMDLDPSLFSTTNDNQSGIGGLAGASGVLTGIEAISLGYSVSFPLSLVINRKVLTKYQMIFRQLFLCKYIERLLSGTWIGQNKLQTTLGGQRARGDFRKRSMDTIPLTSRSLISRMSLLRERMLHFIKMFMYYVFFDVIEPNWYVMETQLRKATTVDEILVSHDDFLNSCLKECMLTHPKLIRVFSSLITTCHAFVEFSESYTRFTCPQQPSRMSVHDQDLLSQTSHPGELPDGFVGAVFEHTALSDKMALRTYEDSFLRQIQKLIDVLQVLGVTETPRLSHLLSQLDFNSFYSRLPNSTVHFTSSPVVPLRPQDLNSQTRSMKHGKPYPFRHRMVGAKSQLANFLKAIPGGIVPQCGLILSGTLSAGSQLTCSTSIRLSCLVPIDSCSTVPSNHRWSRSASPFKTPPRSQVYTFSTPRSSARPSNLSRDF